MKITKFILCMGALLTLNLAPIHAIAGNAGIENGETVICRGQESHTSGPMVTILFSALTRMFPKPTFAP